MTTLRLRRSHDKQGSMWHPAFRRIGVAHDRIIAVWIPTSTPVNNWVAAGADVHDAWRVAGDELRDAMDHVAAQHREISA